VPTVGHAVAMSRLELQPRREADADHFYARIMELASLSSRSQAKKVATSVMGGLLGRLTRLSAGLIADSLPQPIPQLVLGSPTRPRFAPFDTLVEEVSEELGVRRQTAVTYLRAVGVVLEESLTMDALECLRAEIPVVAREILPSYQPVSSERPSILRSSRIEPLCTAPDDGRGRLSYLHTPV
jgi:uncharacterized protein (DUF2267 family)